MLLYRTGYVLVVAVRSFFDAEVRPVQVSLTAHMYCDLAFTSKTSPINTIYVIATQPFGFMQCGYV